jgi:hypothetical protein
MPAALKNSLKNSDIVAFRLQGREFCNQTNKTGEAQRREAARLLRQSPDEAENHMVPRKPPEHITALVRDLVAAGCDMWAFGTRYSIGEPEEEPMASQVREILADFGPREEFREEIAASLHSMARTMQLNELRQSSRLRQ